MPLVVLALGLSACSSAQPVARASAQPSARPSTMVAADPQRCARLARRGFTPCPPTPDNLTLPATRIVNATNGAITDATAQQWGQALRVAQAYYYWAMENGARDALTSGVLSDNSPQALGNMLATDLSDMDMAKQSGGTLLFRPLGMPAAQLVVIPQTLQASMQRQHLTPSPFGMAVRLVGPGTRAIRLSDGSEKSLHNSPPDYVINVLVWGEFKNDPDLGPIWFEYGLYGCDGEVRRACQM